MARLSAALVLLCMLVAAPAHAAGMTEKSDVTIPASDGVNLVGDVYLPGDGKARYPAVVDMEPYGRSTSTDYVPEGYARINTDVRGSGKSGGALCLLCLREAWGRGQPLLVSGPLEQPIASLFAITGLDRFVTVHASRDAAFDAVSAGA